MFADVAEYRAGGRARRRSFRTSIDRAIRLAIAAARVRRCIIIPEGRAGGALSRSRRARTASPARAPAIRGRRSCPHEADLRRAADVLNAGKKVAILVGAGAVGAADEVIAVAETLGAGVAKALLGKAVLPDDLPFVTGSIGLLGTKPSYDLMNGCDTLLMVGSGFP